jgi:hypothetical protein
MVRQATRVAAAAVSHRNGASPLAVVGAMAAIALAVFTGVLIARAFATPLMAPTQAELRELSSLLARTRDSLRHELARAAALDSAVKLRFGQEESGLEGVAASRPQRPRPDLEGAPIRESDDTPSMGGSAASEIGAIASQLERSHSPEAVDALRRAIIDLSIAAELEKGTSAATQLTMQEREQVRRETTGRCQATPSRVKGRIAGRLWLPKTVPPSTDSELEYHEVWLLVSEVGRPSKVSFHRQSLGAGGNEFAFDGVPSGGLASLRVKGPMIRSSSTEFEILRDHPVAELFQECLDLLVPLKKVTLED